MIYVIHKSTQPSCQGYLDRQPATVEPHAGLELQVLRKHTGHIVNIFSGLEDWNTVLQKYCGERTEDRKPILYNPRTHWEYLEDLVAAAEFVDKRPDSIKLIPQPGGLSEIYFVEKFQRPMFILATILGQDDDSEVIVAFKRTRYVDIILGVNGILTR